MGRAHAVSNLEFFRPTLMLLLNQKFMQHFLPKFGSGIYIDKDFFFLRVEPEFSMHFPFTKTLPLEHTDTRDVRDLHHERDEGVTEQLVKEVHH